MAVVYSLSGLVSKVVLDLGFYVGGIIAPVVGVVCGVFLLVRMVRRAFAYPFDRWERTLGRYSDEGRRQAGL